MAFYEWIGFLAACLTTASFVPQAIMVLRTRRTADISLAMYAMFTAGVATWLAYGLMIQSPPVIIANIVTLALAACILCVKLAGLIAQSKSQGASAATSTPIAS